mgnify:CR=1 FL=1
MYVKYARIARKTLQRMLTIKETTSIIMHHLPSIIKSWEQKQTSPSPSGNGDGRLAQGWRAAYRYWYALRIPVYHIRRKMSNHNRKCRGEHRSPACCKALSQKRKCITLPGTRQAVHFLHSAAGQAHTTRRNPKTPGSSAENVIIARAAKKRRKHLSFHRFCIVSFQFILPADLVSPTSASAEARPCCPDSRLRSDLLPAVLPGSWGSAPPAFC